MLGILSTFSKEFTVYELPVYGDLLSITAYDGQVYCLFGSDPDEPTIGHMLRVTLSNNLMHNLFKFTLPTGAQFVIGAPLLFLPQNQFWIVPLGTSLYTLNVYGARPSPIFGTFTYLWNPMVDQKPNLLIGYSKGVFYWIDFSQAVSYPLTGFACTGLPSVNTYFQKVYHLQDCNNELVMYTVDYYNTTSSSVPLDPGFSSAVSTQSTGMYVPWGCGMQCDLNTDCTNSSTCHTCRLGKCVSDGDCGAFCSSNTECFAGICVGDCEGGRCGRIGCSSSCRNFDDCAAQSTTCTICRLGHCVADGECDAYCLTPQDCYGGACVNNCVNNACTKPSN